MVVTQWGWFFLFCLDHFSRQHKNGESPTNYSLPQNLSNRTDILSVRSLHSSRSTAPWGKPSNLWTFWVYPLRPRVPSWTWIRCIKSATHKNTFMSPLTFAMSTATRKNRTDIQLPHPWATLSGDFHSSLLQQPGPHIYGWLHHSCP